MIRNLGKAISILAVAEAREIAMHASVEAWGAPSECHDDVSRGGERRYRQARKHAEAVAQAPLRVIEREASKRGGVSIAAGPRWDRLVGSVITSLDLPY